MIGRGLAAGDWPGTGFLDPRLAEITTNLTEAHTQLRQTGLEQADRPARHQWAEQQAARARIMHTVYVAAHGTTLALTARRNEITARQVRSRRRSGPPPRRPAGQHPEIRGATQLISQLAVAEQFAAGYVADHPPGPIVPPAVSTLLPEARLERVLAVWDVQAHRTLAGQPDPIDLVRIARTQATLAVVTGIITEAAARTGTLPPDNVPRLREALQDSQLGWTRTARRWSELATVYATPDPLLIDAARAVRATLTAVAATPTGWAPPDQIAARVDLPTTLTTLRLSMIAATGLAHAIRTTAAHDPGLTAPARTINVRARAETELAIERSDYREPGTDRPTADQPSRNAIIPLPGPARRGLVTNADALITTCGRVIDTTTGVHTDLVRPPQASRPRPAAATPTRPIRAWPERRTRLVAMSGQD